jgi:hypothetical protein
MSNHKNNARTVAAARARDAITETATPFCRTGGFAQVDKTHASWLYNIDARTLEETQGASDCDSSLSLRSHLTQKHSGKTTPRRFYSVCDSTAAPSTLRV